MLYRVLPEMWIMEMIKIDNALFLHFKRITFVQEQHYIMCGRYLKKVAKNRQRKKVFLKLKSQLIVICCEHRDVMFPLKTSEL